MTVLSAQQLVRLTDPGDGYTCFDTFRRYEELLSIGVSRCGVDRSVAVFCDRFVASAANNEDASGCFSRLKLLLLQPYCSWRRRISFPIDHTS